MSAATSVRAPTGSPANQPSATATIGFTNACVATRVGLTVRSSHAYALYATIDPNTTR